MGPNKVKHRGAIRTNEIRRSGLSNVLGSASAHASSSGRQSMEMGDMNRSCNIYEIPKVKSSPSMVHGRRHQMISVFTFSPLELWSNQSHGIICSSQSANLHEEKLREVHFNGSSPSAYPSLMDDVNHAMVPASESKKIKKDGRSHDSVVMSIFTQPFLPKPQKLMIKYGNLHEEKTSAVKFPMRVPSNLMIRDSNEKRGDPKNFATSKPETDCDRKWRNIFEKSEALRKQRLNRLKEMEIRKMLEVEKQRKIELLKRRAIRAKIREENKKRLTEGGVRKHSKSKTICLEPVVIKRNSLDSSNHEGTGDEVQEWGQSLVPVLRVTQRTVRIERTRIGKNEESTVEYLSDKKVTRTDNTFNVLEASDKIVGQHTDFFLVPTPADEKAERPDSKRFVYMEMRSDSPDCRGSVSLDSVVKKFNNNTISRRTDREMSDEKDSTSSRFVSRHSCGGASDVSSLPIDIVQSVQVKNLAHEFEKLVASKAGPFTQLQDSGESIGNNEVEKVHPKVGCSSLCETMTTERPVIKRIKRRLKKAPNKSEATGDPIVGGTSVDDMTSHNPIKAELDASCTLVNKGIYLESLKLKKLEVRKRLEDRMKKLTEKAEPSGEKLLKQKRPTSAKTIKTVLVKRTQGVGIKISKSNTTLKDSQSQGLGKKKGRPLIPRVSIPSSPSVSSIMLSDYGPIEGAIENHDKDPQCRSKIFEHFGDSKKRFSNASKKKRRPRKKKISQLLDSFKSEIKEAITATASSLSSKLSEAAPLSLEKSRSVDVTEGFSNNSSLHITPRRELNDGRSAGDMDSPNNVKDTVTKLHEEANDHKQDFSQSSNLRSTVNPYPRWNNAAILRARYIKKTRHPELKRDKKRKEDGNCLSLPSSPRALPAGSKQQAPEELSKSLPPTPR